LIKLIVKNVLLRHVWVTVAMCGIPTLWL